VNRPGSVQLAVLAPAAPVLAVLSGLTCVLLW
jgi:hypothetical protein